MAVLAAVNLFLYFHTSTALVLMNPPDSPRPGSSKIKKGTRTVKKMAVAGAFFWVDINRKLKLLTSCIHGTKEVELPFEKDIEVPKWIHPNTLLPEYFISLY